VFVGVVGQAVRASTLTKLLPRLYELDAGRILIDATSAKSNFIPYGVRLAWFADTLLFDGTAENGPHESGRHS